MARTPATTDLALPSNYVEALPVLRYRATAETLGRLRRLSAVRELRSHVLENGTHGTGMPSGASVRGGHAVGVEGRRNSRQRSPFCPFGLYAGANRLGENWGPSEPYTLRSLDR